MKTPKRAYSSGDYAGLFAFSAGTCASPKCPEPIVRQVEGRPIINVQVAHIRALAEGGPRYDPTYPAERLNTFENLLLLCTPHHKLVDKIDANAYPTALLLKWKAKQRFLDGTEGSLTEDKIEGLITARLKENADRVEGAIAKLSEIDAQSAESIDALLEALSRTGQLQDTAGLLLESARKLGHLQDSVGLLLGITRQLANLPDHIAGLNAAAARIQRANGSNY